MDCSPPASSVHGILQARILERVAMPSLRGSSRPRDLTWVSYISCASRWLLYHQRHLGSPLLPLSLWKVIKKKKKDSSSPNPQRLGKSLRSRAPASPPPSHCEGSHLSKSEQPEQWREMRVDGWLGWVPHSRPGANPSKLDWKVIPLFIGISSSGHKPNLPEHQSHLRVQHQQEVICTCCL